jgi:hypothetical protein
VKDAYPLTKVDYAFVPSSNLTQTQADTLSSFIDYVGGPGQASTVLPYGYTPLPSYLQAEDTAAAAKVEQGVPKPTPTPTTTTPTTTRTTQPTGNSVPGSNSGTSSSPGGSSPTGGGSSSGGPDAGSSSAQVTPLLHGSPGANGSPTRLAGGLGKSSGPQSIQAPVTIGSVLRTAGWLLPAALALMGIIGLAGLLLTYGVPGRPKAGRP